MLIEEDVYILIHFFITYQGSELSSSLLEFYDGEILTKRGKQCLYKKKGLSFNV